MPCDERLAERLRPLLPRRAGFVEKKMFGGICHLWEGNICVGVWKQFLIVRIGPDNYAAALAEPHAVEFDVTGKPMRGWVMVEPEGIARDADLQGWIERATDFVRTLPRKT